MVVGAIGEYYVGTDATGGERGNVGCRQRAMMSGSG